MTALPAEKFERRYTYADMLAWEDTGARYELYDGQVRGLASPSNVHQEICVELCTQFRTYLRGKTCKVYVAPFDVRLFEKEGDRPEDVAHVFQPDLLVVCDLSKIDRRGVHGAPDLVIEILSDSSRQNDQVTKFNLYLRAGVREYWIIDPEACVVQVYTLTPEGDYKAAAYNADSVISAAVLDDCRIDMSAVFPEEVKKAAKEALQAAEAAGETGMRIEEE